MLISSLRVQNFRSIRDSGELALGPITLLIGANNSGKSSLLRGVLLAHGGAGYSAHDIRHGERALTIDLGLTRQLSARLAKSLGEEGIAWNAADLTHRIIAYPAHIRHTLIWNAGTASRDVGFPIVRPNHVIVPLLSRRKADRYETVVRRDLASAVGLDDRSLASRLVALVGDHPEARRYREIVSSILKQEVSTYLGEDGPVPGVPLGAAEGIDLERMGEGVRSVVTLASELADESESRLFLIEEPENDLHPAAMGELLATIREASTRHQFIISTHNDVVLRELGSVNDATSYRIRAVGPGPVVTSEFKPLSDVFDRRDALAELGYDYPIPMGWLVLEESTAERFIRDALVPIFAPRLAALRTVSAEGAGNLPRTVASLHHMILFAHLTDRTTARAWVLCDGDRSGVEAVQRLRDRFATWPSTRFETLSYSGIEEAYPSRFSDQVRDLSAASDARQRTREKGRLAEEVVRWALSDPDAARSELAQSANDVIANLRRIESEFVDLMNGSTGN